jgi:two-component system cell cycle sensor histidine kinase/response regulator CckA
LRLRGPDTSDLGPLIGRGTATPPPLQAAPDRLPASEQVFRAVFNGAMDAMLIADHNGCYVDANPAACALFARSREQLLGRSVADFGEAELDVHEEWERFLQDGQMEGHVRVVRPDGSKRDADFRATANILPGLSLSVLRDMTGRRAAESRFRAMIAKSQDGIALVDADGQTIYASPAVERMYGRPAAQLEGVSSLAFVHADDRERVAGVLASVLAKPSVPASDQLRALRPDGSTRWVEATVQNFIDDPAIGAIVSKLRDVTEQKLAEAALRESQRVLEDGQAIAHLGSWAAGRVPGDTVIWSSECARIFGRTLDGAPTIAGFLQLVHPDDRARVIVASERAVAQGTLCETEHRILRPSGEVRWIYTSTMTEGALPRTGETAEAPRDGLPRGYGAVGVVQDITERKRGEDELRASELRYRRMVENTSEGVWTYDAAANTTFMNPRMAEMLGCTIEDAVGKPIFIFMDEAAIKDARARIARRTNGRTERGDFRLRRCDGTEVWVSVHANPLLDQAGHFEGALALVTDITERRRADATRDLLASVVASSGDAIISRSVDGIIRTWNRGAERLTLYSAEEAVGKPVRMLYAPEQAWQLNARRARVDAGDSLDEFEMVVVRKDGVRVDVSLTSSVLTDDDGRVWGASIIARDITERLKTQGALRRSEEQLRQVQKMEAIGSLAGGVAHDFNNLLSVILGYTSLIVDDLKPADPLRVDLEQVQKAGLRATTLTRQLLAFSRQQVLQPVVLDLNQVIGGVSTMLARLLGADIAFSFLASALDGKIHADQGQVEQVIMNLVVNARDAMPQGGTLTLETANVTLEASDARDLAGVAAGPYVLLAVTDTGTGMDAATRERIFEPFFTTKDKSKGTGLGLSTVYGIVQQSGGHIRVYSELGQGTTFKVYLPRTDRVVEAHSSLPESTTLRGTETVLLVEDEEQVRAVMCSVLRRQGYNVLEAQNGGEAFLLCEQFTTAIHLLLTDVIMPRMSGRQLAERLAQLRPAMRVIYTSGYTDDTIVHHGVPRSGIEFIQKPVVPAILLRKVRQVLDAPVDRSLPDPTALRAECATNPDE